MINPNNWFTRTGASLINIKFNEYFVSFIRQKRLAPTI